ncbi:hypothetical protein PMAYCL1PPCAC_01049, partial [Pristionchus mayeri]
MSTIAELMELAEIPMMDDYGAVVPPLHTGTRNHLVVTNELDLEDIEEEEGERKKLLESIFQSAASEISQHPVQHLQPPQQPQLDSSMVPLAGVDTSYAPRPLVSPPSHLQMDEYTCARIFGRKFIGPMPEKPVYCHRCEAPMRICVRKLRSIDHIKEYPSYRCTRKGCQTFKSVRIMEHPEMARAPRLPRVVRVNPTRQEEQVQQQAQGGFNMQLRPRQPLVLAPHMPIANPYAPYASAARRVTYAPAPPAARPSQPLPMQLQLAHPQQQQVLHDPYSSSQAVLFSAARNLLMGVPTGPTTMIPCGGRGGFAPAPAASAAPTAASSTMMTPRSTTPMTVALAPLRSSSQTSAVRQQAQAACKPPRNRREPCTREQRDSVMALLRKYDEELELEGGGELFEEAVQKHAKRAKKLGEPRREAEPEPEPAIVEQVVPTTPVSSPTATSSISVLPPLSQQSRSQDSSPIMVSPASITLGPSLPVPFRSALPAILCPSASSSTRTTASKMTSSTENPLERWMQQHLEQPLAAINMVTGGALALNNPLFAGLGAQQLQQLQ